MKIRTYLIVSYIVILVILAGGMLAISDITVCSISKSNLQATQQALGQLNLSNYQLSEKILTRYGEQLVDAKAEETASALSSVLAGKGPYDYEQMRKDPELKLLATQDVKTWDGIAGYMSLADKKGMSVLHPDDSVQGTDLHQWKDEFPEFWKLVEESFTRRKVKGYYTFIDKDKKPRRRYQVRVHVPGTPFVAVAIVSIDQYFTPVQDRMKQAGLTAQERVQASIGELTEQSRHRTVLFATTGVISLALVAGLFAMGFTRVVSRPITGLRDGVRVMGSGDLQVQVPETGATEVKELAHSFNELGSQLADYIARRDFVRDTFGRYMTKEIADRLLESAGGLVLGGETREITILMSDVRGFSALSADMRPDVLIDVLNRYLGKMIDTLLEYEGVINEIIGDGILAFFGAPADMEDHPARAVACALKMQCAIEEVNAHNKVQGHPTLEMGISVVTGSVVVGNIGSDRRCKYGAVGASVNLAGRVESLAVGGQILMTRSTYEKVADIVSVRNTFSVEMKGLPDPVEVYDVVAIAGRYGIRLNPEEDRLVTLDRPVHAHLHRLAEKVVDQEGSEAAITSISLKSAVCSSALDLALWEDVRCTLISDQGSSCGEIYGKVTAMEHLETGNRITVRFTSLSAQAEALIRNLCGFAEARSCGFSVNESNRAQGSLRGS